MFPDTGDLINHIQDRQDGLDPDIVRCPDCNTPMLYFTGQEGVPEHFYCPIHLDTGWEFDIKFGLVKILTLVP